MKFKFKLGDVARDKITGFEGIVVARSQWLNSCNTYSIQSEALQDGKPVERQHFDEPQMEMVEKRKHKPVQNTGGPPRAPASTLRGHLRGAGEQL